MHPQQLSGLTQTQPLILSLNRSHKKPSLMRASRRLHSSTLLNTGYIVAQKKKMKFARFILWDISGAVKGVNQKDSPTYQVPYALTVRTGLLGWVVGALAPS